MFLVYNSSDPSAESNAAIRIDMGTASRFIPEMVPLLEDAADWPPDPLGTDESPLVTLG
jgi:hypothetical protein